jgi:hypothetical protein
VTPFEQVRAESLRTSGGALLEGRHHLVLGLHTESQGMGCAPHVRVEIGADGRKLQVLGGIRKRRIEE